MGGRHDRPAIERAGHEVRAGAHPEGDGVRFAVFSSVAEGVDLCVFDEGDRMLRDRVTSLVNAGARLLLIDLHEVSYIDSGGIGALAQMHLDVGCFHPL